MAPLLEAFRAIAASEISVAEAKFLRRRALELAMGGQAMEAIRQPDWVGALQAVLDVAEAHDIMDLTSLKKELRTRGAIELASRVDRHSKERNAQAHPVVTDGIAILVDRVLAAAPRDADVREELSGDEQQGSADMHKRKLEEGDAAAGIGQTPKEEQEAGEAEKRGRHFQNIPITYPVMVFASQTKVPACSCI